MTHVEPIPLYFIAHASPPTDTAYRAVFTMHTYLILLMEVHLETLMLTYLIALVVELLFNEGDAVDTNVQRTLGSIEDFYEGEMLLPSCDPPFQFNPVFNLNDRDPFNDGLGHED